MAKSSKSSTPDRPVLQWIMAGLGLLLTLTAAGIIVYEAMQPPSPPDLTAEVTAVRPASSGFVAEIEVRTLGRDTAAAVQVEGRSGAETASASIDYVPGKGRTAVALAFPGEPARAALHLHGGGGVPAQIADLDLGDEAAGGGAHGGDLGGQIGRAGGLDGFVHDDPGGRQGQEQTQPRHDPLQDGAVGA